MTTLSPRSGAGLKPLAALGAYIWRYRGRAFLALMALVGAAAITLTIPLAVRRMIDIGFSATDVGYVDRAFSAMFVLAALLAAASATRYYLVMTLGERIVADIRRDLFAHVLNLSPAFYDSAHSGEITSRLTADTTQIKSAMGASASTALRNLVLFVGAMAMMIVTSPRLSGLVVLAIPLVVLPLVAFGRHVRTRSRRAQDTLADATAFAAEHIGAVRSVQAVVGEKRAAARFSDLMEEVFTSARGATRARAVLTAFAIFIVFSSVVAILWWGAQSVLAGTITGGQLGQFVLYSLFAAGALSELSQVWGDLSLTAGAAERIVDLLATRPTVTAPAEPAALPQPPRGDIRLNGVSLAYETGIAPVLSDITLTVSPGERVAIVGPSGAGKSSLFSLILRYYDPTSGSVEIDGVDLTRADPSAIRERIAFVPQEAVIFAATVADNIRFACPDASDDAVRNAARAARADEFIGALPGGFDTRLGERGVTLSGGQRQRIAIARAVLRDAPILLLDEATSALDAENEILVQGALDNLMEGRTSLVIAHRLATIRSADRIVVIDRGRIIEEGRHDMLIAQNGLYARLAALQFNSGATGQSV